MAAAGAAAIRAAAAVAIHKAAAVRRAAVEVAALAQLQPHRRLR